MLTAANRLVPLLFVLLLAGCSSLLFFPEPGQPLTPRQAFGLDYQDIRLTAGDGVALHAWWLPVRSGRKVQGTLLFLHGNGGNLAWHLGAVAWLPAMGYQVLLLDYRGYGLSQGSPVLPEVYLDIEAAFRWLARRPEVQNRPLVLLGQSLGGALGLHYLAAHPQQRQQLQALVLDGVPARYRPVARHLLGQNALTWALQWPLAGLVTDRDSAVAAIGQMGGLPLLIYHSIDDEVVPFSNALARLGMPAAPRVLQPVRGGHAQTFASPAWRELLLRYLQDPAGFTGIRPLLERPYSFQGKKNSFPERLPGDS